MSNILEKMNEVLEQKKRILMEDEDLQFVEKFSKLKETIEKQEVLMEKCTSYYLRLKQNDFALDDGMWDIERENEEQERERRERDLAEMGEANIEMDEEIEEGMEDQIVFEVPNIARRPLTNEEQQYLNNWGQFSRQMDETLEEITSELEIMITKMKVIDEESRKNMQMTKNISSHMYSLSTDIRSNNKKLKEIVTKLRAPGKICADITLGLVVCLLVGVLVYIIRLYINLE